MTASMRALVADTAATRLAVCQALDDMVVVWVEADDRSSAVLAAQTTHPDICLIGCSLPGGGVETVREICAAVPGTSVVVLADSEDVENLLDSLRAGAIGYVPPNFSAAQLRRAIASVRTEQAAIPRALVMDLVEEIRVAERVAQGDLTAREIQVLRLLQDGQSTAVIASALSISPVTVRRHISVLARKAGVSGRSALIGARHHQAGTG